MIYIGAMSALLLAACGEKKAEKTIPENNTIEHPKSSEQAKNDAEQKAKEETEDIAKKFQ